jgi:hypothetical protein
VHDISPVLVGEIAVYDALHDTDEMGSRFDTVPVPRWGFDEDFAALLDSLEASIPLAQASNLSRLPLARMIHDLSEGLIGEVVDIVTRCRVRLFNSLGCIVCRSGLYSLPVFAEERQDALENQCRRFRRNHARPPVRV